MTLPGALGPAGLRLWRTVTAGLPPDWELDEREHALLELACRQADDLRALEDAVKRDGYTVTGSRGQTRLHPAVAEVRQGRLALARLLGALELPDAEQAPQSESTLRAQRAAHARWNRKRAHGAA